MLEDGYLSLFNFLKLKEFIKLTIEEVSGIFNISKKESEEWGKILKDEGLISLYYPTVGDVELRKKKREKKEEE